ncbi:MAG: hypothetical protein M0C28_01500 [Candidatus Moduliflexus flocculans]|nr:hypothetical protein [Candidatus Moduliflexus flocculans]
MRPKFMTVCTEAIGLLPIMWATGTGADVMKRIAAPVIGGSILRSSWSSWSTRRSIRSGGGISA